MTKPTRRNASGMASNLRKSSKTSGALPVSARKLTRETITHLHETRERILQGRVLKTNSTETLRRFRDGGIEGTTRQTEFKPSAKR